MRLIYVMDPLCGWCYGNSVNTLKLYEKYKDVLDFEVMPGGMLVGPNVRKQSKQMVQYFKKHDQQIQQTTGTEFGERYFELIEDETLVLDSEVPSKAIITVKQLWNNQAVPFTIEVQRARYWHRKDLNEDETYLSICEALQLDKKMFLKTFHSDPVKQATQETFGLAKQYAASYPTLPVEKEDKLYILEQGYSSFENIVNRMDKLIY